MFAEPIRKENLDAFRDLYLIEVGLREFIIDTLATEHGEKWWTALPADVWETCQSGIQYERAASWLELTPVHPLYYVSFPDLRKIIESKRNWNALFSRHLKKRDIFLASLSELEPLRNAVAHNRPITRGAANVVAAALEKVRNSVGPAEFESYCAMSTAAPSIKSELQALSTEAESNTQACLACVPLPGMEKWHEVRNTWWFEEAYLRHPVDMVVKVHELFEEYSRLPSGRGTGHITEKWLKSCQLEAAFASASAQVNAITLQGGMT
jgi:hypothetical protein